jgi:hypothetical protein
MEKQKAGATPAFGGTGIGQLKDCPQYTTPAKRNQVPNTTELDQELAYFEQAMTAADAAGDDSAWEAAFTRWLSFFGERWITPPPSGQAGEVQ